MSEAEPAVVALVTAPVDQARSMARQLVERRLVACVNILPPAISVYRWQGEVEEDEESLLVIKTTAAAVRELDAFLGTIHPYEVYELVVLPISDGNPDYLRWIADSVAP